MAKLEARFATATLAALATLSVLTDAAAQPPPPPTPFDAPPGAQPGAPPPGAQPGAPPGTQPGPMGPGDPGAPPGQFGPPPEGQPGGPGVSFGGQASFGGPQPPPPQDVDDTEERAQHLAEQISLTGSTGLMRTAYAGSTPAGMFRVGFLFDWFTDKGFLCNADHPCNGPDPEDSASHVGAFFALNATPVSFLEAYAGLRTYANSNNQGSPGLLQVLGDTTLGLKPFIPFRVADLFTFGADIRLLLLNGAGDVGVSGSGTSAEFLALATTDLRKLEGKGVGVPFRIHLNGGYRVDNSGKLVEEVEQLRAERNPDVAGGLPRIPITRIERFGLGINRTDFFLLRFGVDVPWRWLQPYAEWTVDIPINRQNYECHTRTLSPGDDCLALKLPEGFADPTVGGPGFSAIPSRFTIGVRSNPLPGAFRGLSGHLAVDAATSGKSTFIEEVAPTAPWTLWFGLGYSFDTKEKKAPAPVVQPPPPPPVELPPPPQYYVRGQVVQTGTQSPVAGAIITVDGSSEPPVASGADGRFLTYQLAPGTYTLNITAPDYNPGKCTATVQPAAQPEQPMFPGGPGMGQPGMGQPGMGQPGMGQPGMGGPGMPPGSPPGAPPGAPPMGAPPAAPPPTGPIYTDIQCELEALPKAGGVEGSAQSADGGAIMGVTVELVDSQGKTHSTSTGADGKFSFAELPLGEVTVKAQADDYMVHVQQTTVRAQENTRVLLTLNKRPKNKNVRITGNQIQIMKQIHFELNSANIKGDSNSLLEEIADVIIRNPNIKSIEIQGHTDNTGTTAINNKLSQDRADAVRTWLVDHGVESGRLSAKGYGASRPLAPNVTPANRARNRRVQFIIQDKQ